MRVLLVSTQSPAPAHGGAALRIRGWLGATESFAEVGLVVLTRSQGEDDAMRRLAADRGWWLATTLSPRTGVARLRDRLLALLTFQPHVLVASRDRDFLATVHRAQSEFRPDVVQAEQIAAAPYLAAAREAGLATVYSAHNIESRVVGRSAGRMRRLEEAEAASANAVVAVSPDEAGWFERRARRVVCVPNAVELERYRYRLPSPDDEPSLLFTGHLRYPPNRDAATVLAREVFPQVVRRLPASRCRIAGAQPGRAVRQLGGGRVEILADFESFENLATRSSVFACPLRSGAGSRLKLLEAAAVGLPIVATPFSAEGLRFEPGSDYLSAETPASMADTVFELLSDGERRAALAEAARKTVEEHHAWSGQRERIHALYEGLLGDTGQG